MVLTLLCGQVVKAQKEFKILSYNILNGLQNDSLIQAEFTGWVTKIDPDIVAFQEMNKFTQKKIEAFAAKYGHPYAVISKTEGFPVALTSKYPIVNVQKVVDNMHHAYLVANINNINVIVIHFSPFSYKKRQLEVRDVLARAALFPKSEKTVIMGDFNSLSWRDAATYGEEDLNAQKLRESKESHIRNLSDEKFDYSVTDAMEEAGFIDALRLIHQDFQYSIPTKKYDSKFHKRIDYLWINSKLKKSVKSADIIRDEVTGKISDHYPIFVTFQLK